MSNIVNTDGHLSLQVWDSNKRNMHCLLAMQKIRGHALSNNKAARPLNSTCWIRHWQVLICSRQVESLAFGHVAKARGTVGVPEHHNIGQEAKSKSKHAAIPGQTGWRQIRDGDSERYEQ
jgi:hypothetical protein